MRLKVLVLCLALGTGMALAQVSHNAMDQQIASYLQQQYSSNKDLNAVHASVEDRVVTLTGSVPNYRAKLEAAREAQSVESVNGLINRITVGGESVSDQQLKQQVAQRLTYDRMGMGQTFNALTVNVNNGIVTVGGEVRGYADRDSALDVVADTKGVKGVVDKIKVAPNSMMDDQIRLAAARAIYGNSSLRRYANDPAHPIRIVVNNGNVTLVGVVTSQLDKTLAGNAVRSLPGVFKVTNDLVVSR